MSRAFMVEPTRPDAVRVAEFVPHGSDTPTQVHAIITLPQGVMVIRFHAGETIDDLIEALHKHRVAVFGAPAS